MIKFLYIYIYGGQLSVYMCCIQITRTDYDKLKFIVCYNDIDKRKRSRAWIVPKTEDKNAFNVEENATESVKDRETPGEPYEQSTTSTRPCKDGDRIAGR